MIEPLDPTVGRPAAAFGADAATPSVSPSGGPAHALDVTSRRDHPRPRKVARSLDRPIKVALVDDHHLFREGLRLVLTARGFDVVGECPSSDGVFELVARERPDVMLLDLSLADADGITVLREVRSRAPELQVIVVTMHRDSETVRQALRAGAAGYIVKGAHSADLYEAIEAVMRGERYLHSSVTRIVVDDSVRWFDSDTVLTAREREIVGLLAGGSGASDVGRRLGISPHTVRRHIANLSLKLGTRGTAALVSYAIREGLVRERPS